jgi:transposase
MRFIRDLTFDTIKLLNRIYKQSSHYQVKQRAHCILLSYDGATIAELMEIFQVSRRTVYNWMNDWEEYRLLGLYNRPGRGRKPIFNEFQQQQIKEWVKLSPKNLKKVLAQIEESWGIKVSKDTIKRILKNLEMTWRRFKRGLAGEPDDALIDTESANPPPSGSPVPYGSRSVSLRRGKPSCRTGLTKSSRIFSIN